ncbi:MAG: hypothetical protein F6K09_03130, partial [Merismopedia sp. SIO2A8]|nr:hypothetical protein [Merismopedia sp. SIO2A8]
MTFRQAALAILTVLIMFVSAGPALIGSLQEQQISDRLELYQTDMVLQVSELTLAVDDDQWVPVQVALVGKAPVDAGLNAYQKTRQTAQDTLERLDDNIKQLAGLTDTNGAGASSSGVQSQVKLKELRTNRQTQQQLLNQLDINIGILQAAQGETTTAIQTWASLLPTHRSNSGDDVALVTHAVPLAQTLTGLWSDPPAIAPDAEQQIQQQLTGWFRDRTLTQLYTLQDDAIALAVLQQSTQDAAQKVAQKLALIGVGPVMGCIIGIGLIIFMVVQRFVSGQTAILAEAQAQQWTPEWNWETTWQVIIVGFFFVGQLVVPLMFQIIKPLLVDLGRSMSLMEGQLTALLTLTVYIAMSAATNREHQWWP